MKYIDYLRKNTWLQITVCALTGLFYVYDYFIQVSPSVITHQLMQAWSLNAGSLSTVLAAFSLAYVFLQIPAGMIFAKYGVRRIFSLVVFVSSIGVFVFTSANGFWVASLGQVLIGAGAAFAFLGTLNLSAQWLSHRYFAMIAGIVQFAGCLGSIVGQEPMANLVTAFDWRSVLFFAAALGVLFSIVFWLIVRDNDNYLPEQTAQTKQIPILKKVLQTRQAWCAFIISFCGWATVGGFSSLWGVPFLVKVQHLTTAEAGSHLVWFWLAIGLGSPLFGYITAHSKDSSKPITLSFLLGLIGFACVMTLHGQSSWWLDISLLLLGLGSVSQALSFGALKNNVRKAWFATATGVNNLMAIWAGALFKLLSGYVLHWMNIDSGASTQGFSTLSYIIAFSPVGVALLVGLITSFFFLQGKVSAK